MAFRAPVDKRILEKYKKETLAIKESLEILLNNFDKIKDWADVEKWLKRVKILFEMKKSPLIPHKLLLFRRLAQCLNPSLPSGCHQKVIEIYAQIIENLESDPKNTFNDIYLITLGLFPFIQSSSNQLKPFILRIISDRILVLGSVIGPMVPALISSLLPVLLENNEEILKKVYDILINLENIFPAKFVNTCVWMAIFRSGNSRFGGIRYLTFQMGKKEQMVSMSKTNETPSMLMAEDGDGSPHNEFNQGHDNQDKLLAEVNDLNLAIDVDAEDGTAQDINLKQADSKSAIVNEENAKVKDETTKNYASDRQIKTDQDNDTSDKDKPEVKKNLKLKIKKRDEEKSDNSIVEGKQNTPSYPNVFSPQKGDNNVKLADDLNLSEKIVGFQSDKSGYDNLEFRNRLDQNKFNDQFFKGNGELYHSSYAQELNAPNEIDQILSDKLAEEDSEEKELEGENEVSINLGRATQQPEKKDVGSPILTDSQKPQLDNEEANAIDAMGDYDYFVNYSKQLQLKWFGEQLEDTSNVYFPHKQLFMESVKKCLKDTKSLVVKKILDFLIQFVPPDRENTLFTEQEMAILMHYVLYALDHPEMSVKRRVMKYVFGEEEDGEEEEVLPAEFRIKLLLEASGLILNDRNMKNFPVIFKILQTILMEKDALLPVILESLNNKIMTYFSHAYSHWRKNEELHVEVKIRRFLGSIENYYEQLTRAYVDNNAEDLKVTALEILLEYNNNRSNVVDNNNDQIIFTGFLKIIEMGVSRRDYDELSLRCYNNLLDIIGKWEIKEIKVDISSRISELLNTLVAQFQNMLNKIGTSFSLGRDLELFEKGLVFAAWVMVNVGDQKLVEDWIHQLEDFLDKIEGKTNYVLASIKGMYKFISFEQRGERNELVKAKEKILKTSIDKSWELLDNIDYHQAAINIILKLNSVSHKQMVAEITSFLNNDDINIKEKTLQRLVIFWKLSYNVRLRGNDKQLEHFVIFRLIDHLENDHPVLRQIARSWLIDSNEFYNRLIDPLIDTLITNSFMYVTVDQYYIHYKEYNVTAVFEALKRMQFLISNNQNRFEQFINNNRVSDYLLIEIHNRYTQENIKQNQTYSNCLVNCIVNFLRTNTLKFMGQKFYDDNMLIKTSSCELLELITKILTANNSSIVNDNFINIILNCYFENVKNKTAVMQIHLLNLLKLILFKSDFFSKKNKNLDIFEKICVDKELIKYVIESINYNKNNYTLLKIIDFLQITIEMYSENFDREKVKGIVELIFNSYTELALANKMLTENGYQPSVVLVEAIMKLVANFCGLDTFIIPRNKPSEGMSIVSVLTFGLYRRKPDYNINFKKIEEYFLEKFDRVIEITIESWKTLTYKYETYEAYNVGFKGHDLENCEDMLEKLRLPEDTNRNNGLCEFLEKLYHKYTTQFFENLLKIWIKEFEIADNENWFELRSLPAKIVDVLFYYQIEFEELIKWIGSSQVFNKAYKYKKKSKDVFYHEPAKTHSSLLALIYAYIKFKPKKFIEDKNQRTNWLRSFWYALMDTLSYYSKESHPMVQMWIINIYYLASNKYPIQEIVVERGIRKTLHLHENGILEEIVDFICDNVNKKFEVTHKDRFGFVLPMPSKILSTAFDSRGLYEKRLTDTYEIEEHIHFYYKIICTTFLKNVTIRLLKATYSANRDHRLATRVYNIVVKLFTYIKKLLADKNEQNIKLYEEIMEYIYIFLDDSRFILMTQLKPLITEFFDSDLFFESSTRSLTYWTKIIDWFVMASKRDWLKIYLDK